MKRYPNILFLMSDEHRADVLGYMGNETIRTPHLDKLANAGVIFRNAYTASPVCVPARQCMMAGQLPKTCGCEGWKDLSPGHMTFSRRLSQFGYATVACGKLHHQGTDMMMGWTQRIGNEMVMSMNDVADKADDYARNIRPFHEYKWDDAKEIRRAGVGRGQAVTMDEYTVRGAIDFIENYFADPYYDREQPDRPLLLKVSLLQPHYPYFTSEEKFVYYLNRVRPFLNQQVSEHPFLSQRQVRQNIDVTERELRRATAAYYAMVETIDDQYGQVLRALESVGQNLEDWIIVYTSDHGEMLGEHGIWEKQKFYEASVRVPLFISWPKGFDGGRTVSENVSLCDLFATLCDLSGIPVVEGLDSRSLKPFLEETPFDWNNEVVSQFGLTNVMIKWGCLKYQYYGTDMPEVLFDLERDPGEHRNVIGEKDYGGILNSFRQRLAQLGHGPYANKNYLHAGYTAHSAAP